MIIGATLFTGGGGADIGMRQAGIDMRWGVEINPAIAAVANANLGGHVQVGDILSCDAGDFEPVDVLHASPPCPSFSQAKVGAVETAHDIQLARQTAHFVTTLLPRVFTLENVWLYRFSRSWHIIEDALHGAGYWVSMALVNAADHGVPQTRKRMIVRAVRGGFVPYLPEPTAWIGWYAAIEDILHTLPESQFAEWQKARMPKLLASFLMQVQGEGGDGVRLADEPMQTVTANHGAAKYRAFLAPGQDFTQTRQANEPSYTISATELKHGSRALLDTGKVVSMTPRALARFQSIPDWYVLPDNARLAAKGIGNAVPPTLMERLYRDLI